MSNNNIFVTRPSLPPLDEFIPYLSRIWEAKQLSNGGPFHREFELALAEYFDVEQVSLFTNATIALLVSLQAAGVTGEVITTPFSFVATSNAIVLAGAEPVFVDVDPRNLNISAEQIEAAITPRTSAILPVHCYGNPCDVKAIEDIAKRHGLKIIYDAAHAFGVRHEGSSILKAGDMSVLSFHATKVFNTFEGGAVISRDLATKTRIDEVKNFGLVDGIQMPTVGLNGKMSEFNAALGLLQLKHVGNDIKARQRVAAIYADRLGSVPGIKFPCGVNGPANGAYYPILITDGFGQTRDELFETLKTNGIISRKYFFPLISDMEAFRANPSADPTNLPIAKRAASQAICLPIYADIDRKTVEYICDLITAAAK
ncbi:DegT/DnrJ/EryC1/StrS family aminotransferase [Mesorhizobium retamae]|uniref:DegT/DnrJ/EryC1/StrS family aminotransferase n=1 Tax=Mesorhizobium retamae TaxID=2912854 RepID=A0ABS9QFX6_9HYPH|nr:DegT/DnrJ/EryC1/StrS family aminotransferase [Mesorhizobium sp. IRAMC:0171]MCG7506280.1 DegT/DnrJ/EryC1/StrS family aminotransferase [Mesorhizobium sp. IRAMC:0171]